MQELWLELGGSIWDGFYGTLTSCVYFQFADGEDYVALADAPVSFMAGNEVGTIVCENVTIINDVDTVESDQSFTVSANSSDPVVITPISQVTVTIVDDDGEN